MMVQIHRRLKLARRGTEADRQGTSWNLPRSCQGLYLPWKTVAPLDGRRYLKLLKLFEAKLKPPAMLWVELGPGIPPGSCGEGWIMLVSIELVGSGGAGAASPSPTRALV
jgi:hypothetical protein